MKIVAFLQNMWVRDPARTRANIAKYGEGYRQCLLTYSLFAGCVTGRRLKQVFGDLCEIIVWEECTREIADNPRDILPPQPEHIQAVLRREQPDIVLAFGNVATNALLRHGIVLDPVLRYHFIAAMHPAARNGAMASLKQAANDLLTYMETP